MTRRQKVLVTGGAGFLGSHLCKSLLEEGNEVICLDNFESGSRENTHALRAWSAFSLLDQDVTTPFDLDVDAIFNLACVASPSRYQIDPLHTLRSSVVGMENVLNLALRRGARVFQASTSEIYGDPSVHPQREEYCGNVNPIGERACYDEGKRCAETMCADFKRVHGLDVRVARIFNTYGPHMRPDDGRVVSNFIVQALLGRPITIYGDGTQTRSFCYVDDLISGIRSLMDHPGPIDGPVNLGNPEEFTVLTLAHWVIELTGSKSRISFKPLPMDDPVKRRPDIRRAKAVLGWEPRHELKEGLSRTIDYFKHILHNERSSQRPRLIDPVPPSTQLVATRG